MDVAAIDGGELQAAVLAAGGLDAGAGGFGV